MVRSNSKRFGALDQCTNAQATTHPSRRPLQGEMAAHFLRHEGFLGSVGAFMKVQAMRPLYSAAEKDAGKVCW